MRISDLIKMGLRNLSRRKARTALTVVGVMIGTISIVVMISIGIGMNVNFTKQMMELGSLTAITLNKNEYVQNDDGTGNSIVQKIDDNLLNSIRSIEHVKAATPVYTASISVTCRGYQSGGQLLAMDLTTLDAFDAPKLSHGEYPTEAKSDAIIFGSDLLGNMYSMSNWRMPPFSADPVKDKLFVTIRDNNFEPDFKIEQKPLLVKNPVVMEQTRNYEGYDWSAYMDIETYRKYYTETLVKTLKKIDQNKALKSLKEYGQIKISVDNVKNVSKVQDAIKELGFTTSSLSNMFEPTIKASNMMQMVLGGVGAVAMLVSAISIANTMIMSIYERTKEIGVMKVLGCVITDIKKLFLFEAGMIGLLGGIIGIILSYITSFCINKFGEPIFSALMTSGNMFGGEQQPSKFSIIPFWLPLAAALFSILVGIVSGYYPARRATKISAIEAMKSEG